MPVRLILRQEYLYSMQLAARAGAVFLLILLCIPPVPGAGCGNAGIRAAANASGPAAADPVPEPGSISCLTLPGQPDPFRFFRSSVPAGQSRTWVDLAWGPGEGPFDITIFAPDAVLGPYTNADDGKINRRIFLAVSSDTGLPPGTWYYEVRGPGGVQGENVSFLTYRNTDEGGK